MTYYPHRSATTEVALQGFGEGSRLVLEFGPDALRLIVFSNKP